MENKQSSLWEPARRHGLCLVGAGPWVLGAVRPTVRNWHPEARVMLVHTDERVVGEQPGESSPCINDLPHLPVTYLKFPLYPLFPWGQHCLLWDVLKLKMCLGVFVSY